MHQINTHAEQIQRPGRPFDTVLVSPPASSLQPIYKLIQSTAQCISMTSTTILHAPYSATHPWESGDWGSSGFGSSCFQKLSNNRPQERAADDSHDMKGNESDDQSPAPPGSRSPKNPAMALKGDGDPNTVLKRSFSTPAVRSMARDTNQQPASATGEKKRNRLGYHRTSIACSKLKAFNTTSNLWPNELVESLHFHLFTSPLPPKENPMHSVYRRPKSMCQLHTT